MFDHLEQIIDTQPRRIDPSRRLGDNFALWSHGLCQDPRLLSNCFKLVVKLGMSNLRLFDGRNNLANVWKSLRGIIYHFALFLKRVRSSEFQCSFAGKIITKSCENAGRLHAMWALCKCFALFFYIRIYIFLFCKNIEAEICEI